ncbi:MAG: thioredoxin domain-containing protein [Gemmatimonadota bacterium]|nr:MAG: thioredoxin domain-containing protein [Gemmatimonadota bacterium]
MMHGSLTLNGTTWPRLLSFVFGLGMVVASWLTVDHFFAANYPATIWAGSFCDLSAFFNCDSSAFATISAVGGVPIGYFGAIVGALICLGAVFPSEGFERSNKTIALLNGVGVVALLVYSVVIMGSLCLLCVGYYLCALASLVLFWRHGIDRAAPTFVERWVRPSPKHLTAFAVVTLVGAQGMALYHQVKRDAQSGGVAARIVEQYFGLPEVPEPSFLSPYWTVRSTERWEDAPIRVVEYGDLLCSDCLVLNQQMERLKEEFAGKLNVAFQFFPLDGQCNDVVEKDIHPGACDVSYMAAYDPEKFLAVHDAVWADFRAAKTPEGRAELARRFEVEAALTDSVTQALVYRILQTGREYEKTSDRFAYGIRSTPTMIINNRMIIGTYPYQQLRAIFQAIVDEAERGEARFIENWID